MKLSTFLLLLDDRLFVPTIRLLQSVDRLESRVPQELLRPNYGQKMRTIVEHHAWIGIGWDGYFDFSLRLDQSVMLGANWSAWSVRALAGNQFVPSETARFIHTAQVKNYEQKTAAATHTENVRTAVYLRQSEQVGLTKRLLFGAFQFCNSPLTSMLRAHFGERPDLYARVALHLFDMLEGQAQPLVGMSQMSAWETLSNRYAKAFLTVCSKASLK